MKRIFIIKLILVISAICNCNTFASDINCLIRSGVAVTEWTPFQNSVIKSNASIESERYGLIRLSLDFYYNNAKIFLIDYAEPFDEGESVSSQYDISRWSFAPLSFLNTYNDYPYWLRLLVSAEYAQDRKIFSTSISTNSDLAFNRLDGTTLNINSESELVEIDSKFNYQEFSFDLFAGLFKNIVFGESAGDSFETFIVKKLLTRTELKLGYFQSEINRPEGSGATLNESLFKTSGYLFGLRSRNRGTPGLNIDMISAYGHGEVYQYGSVKGVNYAHFFTDLWYNWYLSQSQLKMMFTVGVFFEEIEMDQRKMVDDEILKYYIQTGFLF